VRKLRACSGYAHAPPAPENAQMVSRAASLQFSLRGRVIRCRCQPLANATSGQKLPISRTARRASDGRKRFARASPSEASACGRFHSQPHMHRLGARRVSPDYLQSDRPTLHKYQSHSRRPQSNAGLFSARAVGDTSREELRPTPQLGMSRRMPLKRLDNTLQLCVSLEEILRLRAA
jgi:hypothetical protein